MVATTIQQQSEETLARMACEFLTVALSTEQPVVAAKIQQQSSATLLFNCADWAAVTLEEQPVVANKIQQQSSEGFALAIRLFVEASDEQPVVATIIQQQSLPLSVLIIGS